MCPQVIDLSLVAEGRPRCTASGTQDDSQVGKLLAVRPEADRHIKTTEVVFAQGPFAALIARRKCGGGACLSLFGCV